MNILLFEDSEHMPLSTLLKTSLGDGICFSGGAELLSDIILEHVSDRIICFVDYCEDNPISMNTYAELVDMFSDYQNIHIVKIPCMELFAYLLLNHFNVRRKFNVVDNDIMEYITLYKDECINMKYVQNSLEKYMKATTEVTPRCINTRNTRNDSFYKISCKCNNTYCDIVDRDISVLDKYQFVYSCLPARFDNKEIVYDTIIDWGEIMRRCSLVACYNKINK